MKGSSILRKEFRKTFFGYDPTEVRNYLTEIAQSVEEEQRLFAKMEAESEGLRADLGNRFRDEHVISDALLNAQDLSARVKQNAESEAKAIVEQARAEANRLMQTSLAEVEARKAEADRLATETARRKRELLTLVGEASARAGAALKGGLQAVDTIDLWLNTLAGESLIPEVSDPSVGGNDDIMEPAAE